MGRRRRRPGHLQGAIEVGGGSALLVGLGTVYLLDYSAEEAGRAAIITGIAIGCLWMIRSLAGWLRRLRRSRGRRWRKMEGGLLLSLCTGLAVGVLLHKAAGVTRDGSIEAGALSTLLLFSLWLVRPLFGTAGNVLSRIMKWVSHLPFPVIAGRIRHWRQRRWRAAAEHPTREQLMQMDPYDFEALCRDLVTAAWGYQARVCGETGDGGIDLEMWRDGEYVVGQCKRYRGTVPISHVRDFYGAMMHVNAARGYFFTTGRFSESAYEFVEGKPIALIDGEYMANIVEGIG